MGSNYVRISVVNGEVERVHGGHAEVISLRFCLFFIFWRA